MLIGPKVAISAVVVLGVANLIIFLEKFRKSIIDFKQMVKKPSENTSQTCKDPAGDKTDTSGTKSEIENH